MAGRNQHHIPQFLQRGFGVLRSGKPKEIWTYTPDGDPTRDLIKETAAGWDFYSPPSEDGQPTLDDKITDTESDLATFVRELRQVDHGAIVAPDRAADLIMKLAPRSGHLRAAVVAGMQHLATSASAFFSDPDALERMMGLNRDEPGDLFREKLGEALKDEDQLKAVGLPEQVMERAAFYLAKESFDANMRETLPLFQTMLENLADGSEEAVRSGHVRALEKLDAQSERLQAIQSFSWTVEHGPFDGAILPDCVAIAETPEGTSPFMFVGADVHMVIIPLSTGKLLIGRKSSANPFDPATFNRKAAACSHSFFLAPRDCPEYRKLTKHIGEQSKVTFDKPVRETLVAHLPADSDDNSSAPLEPIEMSTWREGQPQQLSYTTCYMGCANDDEAAEISAALKSLIAGLSQYMPLGLLDGMTFAEDYPEALRSVDRGNPNWPPVETVSSEVGVGVSRTVTVQREGVTKAHIVFRGYIARLLVSSDQKEVGWSLHNIVYQLAKVAWLDLVDRSLPNAVIDPTERPLQNQLFPFGDAAIQAYHSSYTSASFGDPDETAATYRDLLIGALDRLKPTVEPVRLAYRFNGDLAVLRDTALKAVEHPLQFMASLLGHCEGLAMPMPDADGELARALASNGLTHWPASFQHDLEQVRIKQGQWASVDELLAINRHVERLLWMVGLFPWVSPEGTRIEVPLVFDGM